jgi:hypothetical protein
VLAYASLFEAEEVTATLAHPLRIGTWKALCEQRRDVARAELFHGGRTLRLEILGLPFGGIETLSAHETVARTR